MNIPSLDAVKALNDRIFAMLTDNELKTLDFYRKQGRKFDVAIEIINKADPVKLSRALSSQYADEIMRSANSRIKVIIGESANALWINRNTVQKNAN